MNEPAGVEQLDRVEEIDLRDYLRVLGKWKWVIVLLTLVAMTTSAFVSYFYLPPVYEAKSLLMVMQPAERRQAVRQADGLEGVVETYSRLPELTLNTYVGQINNTVVMERVINRLELKGYSPGGLSRMVSASAIKDSNLIEIKVAAGNPWLAADVANTVSLEFIDFISGTNEQQMIKSTDFLTKQVSEEQENLRQASEELQKFVSQPRGVDFLRKEIAARMQDLANYKSQANQLNIALAQISAGKNRIEELLAVYVASIAEINTESSKPGANAPQDQTLTGEANPVAASSEHPGAGAAVTEASAGTAPPLTAAAASSTASGAVMRYTPATDYLEQQLNGKLVEIAEKSAQLAATGETIRRLETEIENIQAELAAKEYQDLNLRRQTDRLQQTHSLLVEKATETRIARSIDLGNANLYISAPAVVPPTPVRPNKQLNVAVAAVLGLMISIGLAFLLEFLDNTVKTSEDIVRHTGLSVLGSVPLIRE